MTLSRRRPSLFIATALLFSASGCISAPVPGPAAEDREEVIDEGTPSVYLTCAPGTLPPADRRPVGPAGGRLRTGDHDLTILRSALSATREFTLEQEPRDTVGVTINRNVPEVHFDTSAILFIDFDHCTDEAVGTVDWHVWRMDSTGRRGQKLRTRLAGKRAMTFIDSTSTYMMAN